MARLARQIPYVLLLLAMPGDQARSQEAGQTAFVQKLVEAINSKSIERRQGLLHPRSLPCATGKTPSFYSEMATRQARQTVPANYSWKITSVPPDRDPLFADKLDYPIRPTHLLQLEFPTGPTSSTALVLQIVYDAGEWREVTACPKPETIAAAKVAEEARAEQAKKVDALLAKISPELRLAVVKLLKEGRRVEAIKHYANRSGEDLSTAKDVVERLAAQQR